MMFIDRTLTCVSCGREFVFSAEEQSFFQDKNFQNDPKRCMTCRAKRAGVTIARVETRVNCGICGQDTTVPFKPRLGRPVLCRACFQRALSPSVAQSAAPMHSAVDAA
jgi:CxxC-x17-CxxC domain-containing protein